MTLSNQQQTRIKQLLIDNPEISVEEIRAKLGSDGAALSMDFIAELRADALHCRRLLEQEGLMSPAKKSPARAGSAERESERREGSREATGANGQPIVRPLTNSQQARVKQMLIDNPDMPVDEIRAKLGPDGAFASPDDIADLRGDAIYCRRLLKEQGLLSPAKGSQPPARPVERSETDRRDGARQATARVKQMLIENPDMPVDEIRSKLGPDGAFVSPDEIADLRGDAIYCRRLLKEQGLLSPGKK